MAVVEMVQKDEKYCYVRHMMNRLFKRILFLLTFIVLTVLTQVGGIVLLLCLPLFHKVRKQKVKWPRISYLLIFSLLYLATTFFVIPPLAQRFGRVPLPVFEVKSVQPLTIWTCLLNRHYVQPELRRVLFSTAVQINSQYPGTLITYLDAGFPFLTGFPLLPHLSHDDGRKLDLSFLYNESFSNRFLSGSAPTFIGYGSYEEPYDSEPDMPEECKNKGYWQYGLIGKLFPRIGAEKMKLDIERTKALVNSLVDNPSVEKIFIEPHLKIRMGLNSGKVRFHGCQAVRHDDHIHIQI